MIKIAKHCEGLQPYKVSSVYRQIEKLGSNDVLKLDFNETTIPPSPNVTEALLHFIKGEKLNWYPDPECFRLTEMLSKYTGADAGEILPTHGSDEALETIVKTFINHDDEIIVPVPTYDNLRIAMNVCGGRIVTCEYNRNDFSLDIGRVESLIGEKTRLIYLVNPNNPLGTLLSREQILNLLERYPQVMTIVDEAYYEFGGVTVVDLIRRYPNLVVARTFSKAFGIASMRVGYLVSDAANIKNFCRVKNLKTVTSLGQVAAVAALEDIEYMKQYVCEVEEGKEYLVRALRDMGFVVSAKYGNFILIKYKDPEYFVSQLARDGIFVRNRSHMPLLNGYVRMTVGTPEQCKKVVKVISDRGLNHNE